MTLDEFKAIYWWEWGHRQLGRAIGAVWARRLPLVLAAPPHPARLDAAAARPRRPRRAAGRDRLVDGRAPASPPAWTSVASYRLAVHLGLAFLLLGLIAWYVLRLGRPEAELLQARRQRNARADAWGTVLIAVAFVQILLGALVAGIDAGRNYTDWPLMGGEIFPSTAFNLEPFWSNFLANPGLVQFNHRLVGYVLFVLGLLAWLRSRVAARSSASAAPSPR